MHPNQLQKVGLHESQPVTEGGPTRIPTSYRRWAYTHPNQLQKVGLHASQPVTEGGLTRIPSCYRMWAYTHPNLLQKVGLHASQPVTETGLTRISASYGRWTYTHPNYLQKGWDFAHHSLLQKLGKYMTTRFRRRYDTINTNYRRWVLCRTVTEGGITHIPTSLEIMDIRTVYSRLDWTHSN
jgi:hypothetical protein